jgi:S-(hydroxymethyl)glutathione dehydrogenase / alcohol dehydrogenase
MTHVQALVLRDGPGVAVETLRADDPGPGEVAVRMVGSGICGSDLHVFHGVSEAASPPMVLGHEGAGVVEAVGPEVASLAPGDHVVLASTEPCHRCDQCLRGSFYFCSNRRTDPVHLHDDTSPVPSYAGIGSMAEWAVVSAGRAIKVADDVDLALLATVGCGVLTGLGAVFNTATPAPGESVLVVGCGGVGLNVVQGARLAGAGTIIAVDTKTDRLDLASTFGATHCIDASNVEVESAVRAVAPAGVDLAFEVVGDPALLVRALELTRLGGTCVLIGAAPPGAELTLPARYFMMTEKHLTGSLMGHSLPARDVPKIVELYRRGQILLDELVGERLPFADWQRAVADTESGRVARCVLTF